MARRPDRLAEFGAVRVADLLIVLRIAELGGIRKAARALKAGQSAVTRRLQWLEDSLGVSLFERQTTGVELTHAGEAFITDVRRTLESFDHAVAQAQSAGVGAQGRLRLGRAGSPPPNFEAVLTAFASAHRRVRIDLKHGAEDVLLTELSHRRLDAVCLLGEVSAEHGERLILGRAALHAGLPEGRSARPKPLLGWSDLYDAAVLVGASEGGVLHGLIARKCRDLPRPPRVQTVEADPDLLAKLAAASGAVAVFAGARPATHDLQLVPLGEPADQPIVTLVWRFETDNPALRRFVSLARRMSADASPSQTRDRSP